MEKINIYKQNKAITLIALVITIVILIILAGITLFLALGENGILNRSERLQKEQDIARITEKLELEKADVGIENEYKAGVPDYIKHIVNKGIIKDEDILDPDNVENGKCYIIVEDKYIYEIKQEGDNIKITYVEDPLIIGLDTTTTTNSIKVKVRAYNLNSEEYTYYIKKDADSKYEKKKIQKSNEYTYENLTQGEIYEIKVQVKVKNNKTAELSKKVKLTTVKPATGAITFENITWDANTHTASVSMSTQEDYQIQYQRNATTETIKDNTKWTTGTTATGLNLKDVLYARLWDGINGGSPATIKITDGIAPIAKIELSSKVEVTGETIKATIEQIDNESGIDIGNCKWVYNKISTKIGIDSSKYNGTFTNEKQIVDLNADTNGTWYVHVLSKDKAGNAIENISEAITINTAPSVTDVLKPGDYVKYIPTIKSFNITTEQTGYDQVQSFTTNDYTGLWQVLYNDNTNGVQLISADSVGKLYISNNAGYNNIFETLNTFCKNYENPDFAVANSGRTIGTSGIDITSIASLIFNSNTGLKEEDTRYVSDYQAMKKATSQNANGIQDIGGYYWTGSRKVFKTSEVGYFSIYTIANGGEVQYRRLKDIYINGKTYDYKYAYGVRPIIKIKNEIKAVRGNGTSSNPYQIRK